MHGKNHKEGLGFRESVASISVNNKDYFQTDTLPKIGNFSYLNRELLCHQPGITG